MARQEFLGHEIRNTGNGDGFVPTYAKPYQHLGNFQDLDRARREVFLNWCGQRPETIALLRAWCLRHSCLMHSYDRVKKWLEKDGFEMPQEITHTTDGNRCVLWNGAPLYMQPDRRKHLEA